MDEIFNYNQNCDEDYYRILGCDENSSLEQIVCEYRSRALRLHPDKQIDKSPQNEHLFKQLIKAKQVLTDPQMRKSYDKWRASGIAMSFDKWMSFGKEVRISMHWINKSKKELMLEDGHQNINISSESAFKPMITVFRNDSQNEMLNKFRNYEI